MSKLAWSTESTGPRRFVSVHGRRAAIFGYSQDTSEDGLEVWAYPVQVLSSYRVTFRQQGATTGIDGDTLLRRIVYSPEATTRIYAGSDFIVREHIFIPLDEPGAIIQYKVESTRPIDIEIHFVPVLDLMWPGSIGGQEALWNPAASAYSLSELTHRFSASIGSPDIVAHDDTPNAGQHVGHSPGLAFTIRAGGGYQMAQVFIAGNERGQDAGAIAAKLLKDGATLEKAATDHYIDFLSHSLQIETPDAETNRALAWSEIALDQAWVCNPDLGCGVVAGYGPSRKARRPQYDWFFAGDGMVAIQGLLAAGQYDLARQELEFILKYQDKKTGMVWHELSQSAALLDWVKYPYMFVHVDLSFDFLETVGDYFSVTGDQDFVRAHWSSIQSAYEYCRSLQDPKDGLPRIPSDKEGGREQDPLSDELALSASWVRASQAFADLARATGHKEAADETEKLSERASRAINARYWNEQQRFWITGYTRSGTPVPDRDLGPVSVLTQSYFSHAQRESLFDQLASSDFQTDWGSRGRASSTGTYNPNSYSSGSVWATGSSGAATAFWTGHRPATALPIWSALVPWSSLDSVGHMHEALAGDYYHEEVESVPEQTWSSASFLTATVNGLLGLRVEGTSKRLTFAPHLPTNWNTVTLRNLRVADSEVGIHMVQSADEIRLEMDNTGTPVKVVFDPEIPLGAKLIKAELENRTISATMEEHMQDAHARMEFDLPHGNALLTIGYTGGVAIIPAPPHLMIGEPSKAMKITGVNLEDRVYTVGFDYLPSTTANFELQSPWIVKEVLGATSEATSPGHYRSTPIVPPQARDIDTYQHAVVKVTFAK